jgi:hypothetical protein
MLIIMKVFVSGFVVVLLFVHMYRYYMKINSKDTECDDILNAKLFDIDIPVCLWNIAHVITFVILSHVIGARSLYDHTKLLLVGIIWYIIEHSFSQPDRVHDCTTIDNVYKNTSKPRYDDIFFNTFGQVIYIISRLPVR